MFAVNFERLRRSYELSRRTFDVVSLLDLSHHLRVWTELATRLKEQLPAFGADPTLFRTACPNQNLKDIVRGRRHVVALLPGGTDIFPRGTDNVMAIHQPLADRPGEVLFAFALMRLSTGGIRCGNYVYVHEGRAEPSVLLDALRGEHPETRCDFGNWLAADAVRVGYLDENGQVAAFTLSRKQLICTVANTMGGSHASGLSTDAPKRQELATRELAEHMFGAVPLAYFLLLKVAQDLLEAGKQFKELQPR